MLAFVFSSQRITKDKKRRKRKEKMIPLSPHVTDRFLFFSLLGINTEVVIHE